MKTVPPTLYARAFFESTRGKLGGELEKLIENFIGAIKKTGGWSKRHEIARQVETLWRREHGQPLTTIESARPLSQSQENRLKKNLGGSDKDYETKINPALIAGVRVRKEDLEIDGSLAHLLKHLFPKHE